MLPLLTPSFQNPRLALIMTLFFIAPLFSFGAAPLPHTSAPKSREEPFFPMPPTTFEFPQPPSSCTTSSPMSDLMRRFEALRASTREISCLAGETSACVKPPPPEAGLNCAHFLATSALPDKASLTCEEVDPENMGANAIKVLILKKAGVATYAVKGFSRDDSCRNEARKLGDLNRVLESAVTTENPLLKFPSLAAKFPLIIPRNFHVSQMVDQNLTSPCYVVLEAAAGKPVYDLASQYMESGTGDVNVFSQLGTELALLHVNNISNEQKDLSRITTATHGDFHWNNVFFDPVSKKFTLIDNSTFTHDRKGSPGKDLNTSLRDISLSVSDEIEEKLRAPEGSFHWEPEAQQKARRKIELIKNFISGYSSVLTEKGINIDSHPAQTKLEATYVQSLTTQFNSAADKCIKSLCPLPAREAPPTPCPACPAKFE